MVDPAAALLSSPSQAMKDPFNPTRWSPKASPLQHEVDPDMVGARGRMPWKPPPSPGSFDKFSSTWSGGVGSITKAGRESAPAFESSSDLMSGLPFGDSSFGAVEGDRSQRLQNRGLRRPLGGGRGGGVFDG